ncbi:MULTISPECIES: hypothetical protein [Bacillus]|nr:MULTISPECIES: hypothetical protein [Bacillus]KYD01728.1 hypothetical protein B4144_2208 [Bacillus atrophaeus]
MKREQEQYIYDEKEGQETIRQITDVYQSGFVELSEKESPASAE